MSKAKDGIRTRLIHAGELRPGVLGSVRMPMFQSSTYESGDETDYDQVRYVRLNNTPNVRVLVDKLADLEGTEAAMLTASGMAAITTAILTAVQPGDHILVAQGIYGGTQSLLSKTLAAQGITHTLIDGTRLETWEQSLRPSTRLIYAEAISNPLIRVPELEAIAAFSTAHGILSFIDSTFATPVNFRPATLGFDVVLHSATKYLGGHSDLCAGAVMGSKSFMADFTRQLNIYGACLDPFACFLLHRSLFTLSLRVQAQNASALQLATMLQQHPAVTSVNYAGLPADPSHERAKRWFGGFGGMLSFEPNPNYVDVDAFLSCLRLAIHAPSLGGAETLVTRPARTSHLSMTPAERQEAGVSDHLVRVSVGLEDADDLVEDFDQALRRAVAEKSP